MSNESNWQILRELYEKCIVASESEIKGFVGELPKAAIFAAVDPALKKDYVDAQLTASTNRVLTAIEGSSGCRSIMKLVSEEAKQKTDENNTSKNNTSNFDVDTFIATHGCSTRSRKAIQEAFLTKRYNQVKQRSLPVFQDTCIVCRWSQKKSNRTGICTSCNRLGATVENPPALRGPWEPLHPDYDRNDLY